MGCVGFEGLRVLVILYQLFRRLCFVEGGKKEAEGNGDTRFLNSKATPLPQTPLALQASGREC